MAGEPAIHATAFAAEAVPPPRIHPGAIELGIAGNLTSIDGSAQGAFAIRGGLFLAAGSGTLNFEIEPSYAHVHALDVLDLQAAASWQHPIGKSAAHVFAGIGGGLRQEWLGSFRQLRYPVGAQLGLRALVSQSAGVRLEYRYRRVLDDPVANYGEHGVVLGLSIFLKNRSGG